MSDGRNVRKALLISGMVGILGVAVTIISDLILLGRPDSGYSFFLLPTECMTGIPGWRITLGTFLGVFALPFQIAGLVPLYIGLKPSGKAAAAITGLIGSHGLIMGVAFHTTYAFLADGWKLYHLVWPEAGGSSAGPAIDGPLADGPAVLMESFQIYWKLLIVIMVTELILMSTIYVFSVLKGNSLFPKWMAAVNPAVITTAVVLILLILPAPVGGYAAPTMLNLSTLTFIIISSSVIYKRVKRQAVII